VCTLNMTSSFSVLATRKNETLDVVTWKEFTEPRSHKGWETLV